MNDKKCAAHCSSVLVRLHHCDHTLWRLLDAASLQGGDESPPLQHPTSLPSSPLHPATPTTAPGG